MGTHSQKKAYYTFFENRKPFAPEKTEKFAVIIA